MESTLIRILILAAFAAVAIGIYIIFSERGNSIIKSVMDLF